MEEARQYVREMGRESLAVHLGEPLEALERFRVARGRGRTAGVATASAAAVMVLLFLLSATARRGSLRQCVGALADGRRREGVEGVAAHGNGRLPEGEQRGRALLLPHVQSCEQMRHDTWQPLRRKRGLRRNNQPRQQHEQRHAHVAQAAFALGPHALERHLELALVEAASALACMHHLLEHDERA